MRRSIKLGVVGFLIGVFTTFGFLFFHESRDELANMYTLAVMGLVWAGMAVAAGTGYNRPVRGAILGLCMWTVLTFWIMPGPEPSNLMALLVPGSDPDGAMLLVGKGAMWVVAGVLIGKTWDRTGLFAGSHRGEYNPNGLSATTMAIRGTAEGAVIGFAMGAFISGLWDLGLVAPEGRSDIILVIMVVVLVVIGAAVGSLAGLKKWHKRALVGAVLIYVSWVCVIESIHPGTLLDASIIRDTPAAIFTGDLPGMMNVIEDNIYSVFGLLLYIVAVGSFGAMLGAMRGVDRAGIKVLAGSAIAIGIVFFPLLFIYALNDQPIFAEDTPMFYSFGYPMAAMVLGTIGGSIALRIGR